MKKKLESHYENRRNGLKGAVHLEYLSTCRHQDSYSTNASVILRHLEGTLVHSKAGLLRDESEGSNTLNDAIHGLVRGSPVGHMALPKF